MGYSRFEYVIDCLIGTVGRIRIFDDRIILCGMMKNQEFFLQDIKSIQVAKFFRYKVGIIIHLASSAKSPYIRFGTLSENKVEAMVNVLIAEGYPVEKDF